MNNQIGSIVQFADSIWGVYCAAKAKDENSEAYGISLLVAQYFARMYSTVRIDKKARAYLLSVLENPILLYAALSNSQRDYAKFYKNDEITLRYDLTQTQGSKKEVSFFTSYDLEGHFSPKLKPKGFGLLGKNIESASVSACLATAVYFIESHEEDEDIERIVMQTIGLLGTKILHQDKLSVFEESKAVRETVISVMNG